MPHQIGVTIRAMVAAEQVADLRKWLTASAPQGLADGPFRFRHMRGLHFAKLFLIEQTDDLKGNQSGPLLICGVSVLASGL